MDGVVVARCAQAVEVVVFGAPLGFAGVEEGELRFAAWLVVLAGKASQDGVFVEGCCAQVKAMLHEGWCRCLSDLLRGGDSEEEGEQGVECILAAVEKLRA